MYLAFDANSTTYWASDRSLTTFNYAIAGTKTYIEVNSPVAFTAIGFYIRKVTSSTYPVDWKVQAYNGFQWIDAMSISGNTDLELTYQVAPLGTFQQYRLEIYQQNAGATAAPIEIAEFKIYGY